ncbi:MAG TPA: hypothetical protein DD827_11545, partial [Gammaproteobacteria bacterium]|nr:hypothetical protein [Gammaproteobacteria bacterium]
MPAGTTYYGFSYFADDVTNANADPATFPSNTGNAGSGDEADLYGGTAGYFTIATQKTIGGNVFQDDDRDGSQNGAEVGLGDVNVSLYEDTNANGIFDNGTDQQVGATVVTNGTGAYSLTAPAPANGNYFVLVDDTDTDLPANHSTSVNPLPVTIASQDVTNKHFPFAPPPPPVVNALEAINNNVTTEENQPVDIDVLDNDISGNSVFNLAIEQLAANGTAVVNGSSITYTPNPGFDGNDSFQYKIDNDLGDSDIATVNITVTPLPDFDQDGIPDSVDIDDDNDGILDTVEGNLDFDGDGNINSKDLDADGDGINDLEESGLNEAAQTALDSNNDGEIDSTQAFGDNGLADNIETNPESGTPDYAGDGSVTSPVDTDGDTHKDFLDLDSDNDGILDVIEAGLVDADGDGEADSGQASTNSPVDTDGDSIA